MPGMASWTRNAAAWRAHALVNVYGRGGGTSSTPSLGDYDGRDLLAPGFAPLEL
jgi:hypothetical protein